MYSVSLDHVDPAGDCAVSNLQLATVAINFMKNNFSSAEADVFLQSLTHAVAVL
jgi:hypothetical protein